MNCLHLVEMVDFDIKIVLIQGRMQPLEAKQGQKQKLQSHFGPNRVDLIGETELVRKFTREFAMLTR